MIWSSCSCGKLPCQSCKLCLSCSSKRHYNVLMRQLNNRMRTLQYIFMSFHDMHQEMHNQIVLSEHRPASGVTVGIDAYSLRQPQTPLCALQTRQHSVLLNSSPDSHVPHLQHNLLSSNEKTQMQLCLPVFRTRGLCAILPHNKQESHCPAATSGPPRTIYTTWYQASLPAYMTREIFAVLIPDVQKGEEEGGEEEKGEGEELLKQNFPSKYFWVEHSTRKLCSSKHASNTEETSNKYLTKFSLYSQVWSKDASSKVESSFLGRHLSDKHFLRSLFLK